jgi:hypothetical protein
MSYLNKKNPYNPGYALPKNVLAEPERRGTFTTRAAPRGTIDTYRAAKKGTAWDPGYALPSNVLREKPGQGVLVTNWAPKGTIDSWNPSNFRKPGSDAGIVATSGLGSLGDDSLGYQLQSKPVTNDLVRQITGRVALPSSSDALAKYGKDAARIILANVNRLPPDQRATAIKEILGQIHPSLVSTVEAKAKKIRAKRPGASSTEVLERAASIALANHLSEQMIQAGKTGRVPTSGVLSTGGVSMDEMDGPLDLSNWLGDAYRATKSAVKTTVSAVKSLTCKVTGSNVGQLAAGGAALASGAPPQVGIQGAQTVNGAICPQGTAPVAPAAATQQARTAYLAPIMYQAPQAPAAGGMNKTVLIVGGVAAVGLLAFLVMKK